MVLKKSYKNKFLISTFDLSIRICKLIQLNNLKKINIINIDNLTEFTFMIKLNSSNYSDHNFFLR